METLLEAVRVGRLDVLLALIQVGANPDGLGSVMAFTWTPLALAAHRNRLDLVRALVEAGANVDLVFHDPDFPERGHMTALASAIRRKRTDVIAYLAPRCSPATVARARSAEEQAAGALFEDLVTGIYDDIDEFRLALADGANPDLRTSEGFTPLHLTAGTGRDECVRLLLSFGADVDAVDPLGRTAVFLATDPGDTRIIRILLEAGARVDIPDRYGQTPLFRSADPEIVRMFLAAGADPNTRDKDRQTPLEWMSKFGAAGEETIALLGRAADDPEATA